jgi:chloramphenicol-sensitive protein RarD
MDRTTQGTITSISAYLLWGFLPIYWKHLAHVPSTQIVAHRVIWSLVFLVFLLLVQHRWSELKHTLSSFSRTRTFLASSLFLAGNWLIFIWAVNANHLVEVSLGYFINPLVTVCLGVVVLRERLDRWQAVSVGLAFVGVLYLTLHYGRVPWISLAMAFTFGTYGILRKTASAESMVGLSLEMGILTPLALVYLFSVGVKGSGAFLSTGIASDVLLVAAGVITAVPLLLFAHGVRRIRYSTVGLLQYIGPTCHLILAVFLYGEPFASANAVSFGFVWAAVILYSISSLSTFRTRMTPS